MGTARIMPGMIRSLSARPSVLVSSCRNFASATIRATFMSSLGCSENVPMGIQRVLPRMLRPSRNTSTSSTMPPP
jgi:hypothetical protein